MADATPSPRPAPASLYLHGTSPGEQRRLARMNDLINRPSLRQLALRGGERILEVGSGLGQMARAMARAAGRGGSVLALERSPAQLATSRRLARRAGDEHLVSWRRGDALAPPLRRPEWGTFDLAHTRFLLEHVPDPLAVVRMMVRAVRPGGRIILEDDDHGVLRMWPEPAGFASLWRAYIRTYDRNGNDPYVGRRLVSLLHEAGAAPARNTWLFFGSCAGDPDFPHYVDNLIAILRGTREAIVGGELLDAGSFDAALRALGAWRRRKDAALWYAIAWAEGVRRPRHRADRAPAGRAAADRTRRPRPPRP